VYRPMVASNCSSSSRRMRRAGKLSNDRDRNQQISTVRSPVTYITTDADNAPTACYKTITSSEKPRT
jgi:hypothetical protein